MRKDTFVLLSAVLFGIFFAARADALCVQTGKANVRSGPGTAYGIVWEVYRYMPFKKVGTSLTNDWYAVKDVDGDVNWVHKSLVTRAYSCAVVKAEEVHVRTGPGTRYALAGLSSAKKYYSFRVLDRKGSWVKLRDEERNTGWVHANYLWIP